MFNQNLAGFFIKCTSIRSYQSGFLIHLRSPIASLSSQIHQIYLKTIYMKTTLYFSALIFLWLGFACQSPQTTDQSLAADTVATVKGNPPAEGFNEASSDEAAIAIADQVMEAMGGRTSWDTTQFFSWNFFGARRLYWDKFTGDVRIDYLKSDLTAILNVNTMEGKVKKDGVEMTEADSLSKYLTEAKNAWINDGYWLFMPFKLKDSGVTLQLVGQDTVPGQGLADVLQLTFDQVGVTPQNKYLVYVDQDTHLVSQWAYFQNAEEEEPRFVMPWLDYAPHGDLMLSGNRQVRQVSDIRVYDALPPRVFNSLEPVDFQQL